MTISDATRKKLSDSHKGKKLPLEQRQKIAASLTGRPVSDETRKKLSMTHQGITNPDDWKGFSNKKRYYEEHKEEIKKKSKQHYDKHKDDENFKEQKNLHAREYRKEHNEEMREHEREYRKQNKEKLKARHKKWRDKNPDKIKAWVEITKDKLLNDPITREHYKLYRQKYDQGENRQNYLKQNREKRNKRKKDYYYENQSQLQRASTDRHRKIRLEVLQYYSQGTMKCNNCGERHVEFLEVDHINGGGRKHKQRENITDMYNYLKNNNFPDGYQILCANCNIAKLISKNKIKNETGTKSQQYVYKYRCKLKLDVFSHYLTNGKLQCSCPNCNENNIDKLCLDHINNDGSQHRKELKSQGKTMYIWIKQNNYPSMFRILCINCNKSLGNRGYCPHNIT